MSFHRADDDLRRLRERDQAQVRLQRERGARSVLDRIAASRLALTDVQVSGGWCMVGGGVGSEVCGVWSVEMWCGVMVIHCQHYPRILPCLTNPSSTPSHAPAFTPIAHHQIPTPS